MASQDPGHEPRFRRENLKRLPGLVRAAVRMVYDAAPRLLVLTIVLQLAAGVVLAVQVLLTRELFTDLLDSSHGDLSSAYPVILGLTAAIALTALAGVVRFEVQPLLGEKVTRYALERVVRIASTVELRRLEDSDYHDRLQRALINSGVRSLQMTVGLTTLVGSLVSAAAVGVALAVIQPWLFVAALLAGIPLVITTLRASRVIYQFTFDQTPVDRRRIYLQTILTQQAPAKDIRSYNLVDYLHEMYSGIYDRRIAAFGDLVRGRVRRGALSSVMTALISGGALALLVHLVDTGRLSLASAGAAGAALLILGNQLQAIVAGAGGLYESSLFMGDFFSFMEEAEADREREHRDLVAPQSFHEISIESLSFTYPNGDRPALDDVSMVLPAGKVIALVGENGSGKTTLAKLVAGLYQPDLGRIAWDGEDASSFDQESLRDRIAVLFQDFSRFSATASENIGWGRWQRIGEDQAVETAAETADALDFLGALPRGMETQIGPEFLGGIELSGGQWQRVAIARALFRDTNLIILDEPAAALDPRAEAALFADVQRVFHGKTVLMVTHRMATVRTADYIYVLDEGGVVEEGTHRDLVALGGRYAEMYALQSRAFET